MLRKIKLETELWMDIDLDTVEAIREEFEDLAWVINRKPSQPFVEITTVSEENTNALSYDILQPITVEKSDNA